MLAFYFVMLTLLSTQGVESQMRALATTLRYLYQQKDFRQEFPVNVFIDSQNRELEYLRTIQNDCGLAVLSARSYGDFHNKMKDYRMKWKGWVNVLEPKSSKDIMNYFEIIRSRWYTHDRDSLIGSDRMMDFIFDNIVHVIVENVEDWNEEKSGILRSAITEEMLVLLILHSSNEKYFRVYFNRASSNGLNQMEIINFWSEKRGWTMKDSLYPSQRKMYMNLNGRLFQHPVLHKPPWNYVTYGADKDFIEDNGGRDITLLNILSQKLNFKHVSSDPAAYNVVRTRGSKFDGNYSFPGIIGALHYRRNNLYFYLGDTTQTYGRNKAVDFSFYVLADAGAFATTAGRSYVPPDLLIKPFAGLIWAIILICFIVGCLLTTFIYHHFMKHPKQESLMDKSIKMGLVMVKLFMSQSDRTTADYGEATRDSFRIVLGTYAITMNCILAASYSGMLVSFFSLPSYEKTLNTLEELNEAMSLEVAGSKMSLGVVEGSSSYGIISTGGGVYREIWNKMQTQELFKLDSVNQGLEKVLSDPKFAVFAGRQKLIFDTLRLGGKTLFHVNMSPFFVKYKCVAFRSGSPLKEAFNKVILELHAGGIIDKITSDEFNGLTPRIGRNGMAWEKKYEVQKVQGESLEQSLPKIAMKHISAIFYCLLIFHFVAFLIFFGVERRFYIKFDLY